MQMPHPRQRIWRFPPQKGVDSSPKKVRKKQKKNKQKTTRSSTGDSFSTARTRRRTKLASKTAKQRRPAAISFVFCFVVATLSSADQREFPHCLECSKTFDHLLCLSGTSWNVIHFEIFQKEAVCRSTSQNKRKTKKTVKQKKNDTADRKFPLGGTKSKIPVSLSLFFLLYQRRHWRHFRFTASRRRVCVSFLFYFIFLRRSLRRRCGRPPSAPKKT